MSDQTDAPVTRTFEWGGHAYTIPADPDSWPFEAVEAMEEGKALTFVRQMLGPEQMRQFRSGGKRTAKDGAEVMKLILDPLGAPAGE